MPLSEAEMLEARESGAGFFCAVHAAEVLPVEPEPDAAPAWPADAS